MLAPRLPSLYGQLSPQDEYLALSSATVLGSITPVTAPSNNDRTSRPSRESGGLLPYHLHLTQDLLVLAKLYIFRRVNQESLCLVSKKSIDPMVAILECRASSQMLAQMVSFMVQC